MTISESQIYDELPQIQIQTDRGNITIELFEDGRKVSPKKTSSACQYDCFIRQLFCIGAQPFHNLVDIRFQTKIVHVKSLSLPARGLLISRLRL